MSKCTPGPWVVEPGGFVGGPIGYGRVCQTWNKFEEYFKNCEANARLIAAAPDLLEACRLVHDCAFLDSRCTEDQWNAAVNAVESAIAKAVPEIPREPHV